MSTSSLSLKSVITDLILNLNIESRFNKLLLLKNQCVVFEKLNDGYPNNYIIYAKDNNVWDSTLKGEIKHFPVSHTSKKNNPVSSEQKLKYYNNPNTENDKKRLAKNLI